MLSAERRVPELFHVEQFRGSSKIVEFHEAVHRLNADCRVLTASFWSPE
jgi:hypothetical protein